MDEEDRRIFFIWSEIDWFHQPTLNFQTVGIYEITDFHLRIVVFIF